MRKLEYSNLVIPLSTQNTPAGLYEEPCVWMEAKDLEGFNAHFSYGFIKEESTVHPIEGHIIHPYDECLSFAGINNTDITYLGAEVSIELGEEREVYSFNKPTMVLIPKGTPHGAIKVKNIEKPIVHMTIGLAPEFKAESIPTEALPPIAETTKHLNLVKPFLMKKGKGGDYSDRITEAAGEKGYLSRPPKDFGPVEVADGAPMILGPANADQMVWLFGHNLMNWELNFSWGYYTQSGIWHRGGEAHTHPEEEILLFIGLNPDDINYLGSEQEIALGADYERHVFNKPSVVVCPKGFPHLPLITRWVDKPYAFSVINLNAGHDSPWYEDKNG